MDATEGFRGQNDLDQNSGFDNFDDAPAISWSAQEFIANDKTAVWYGVFIAVVLVLAAIVFVIAKHDIFSVIVIIAAAIVLGIYAARKPKMVNYTLDGAGLHIDRKLFSLQQFRSFSVVDEGNVDCIWLTPLKRFAPAMAMYFSVEDEDAIIEVLSNYLPHEERQHDLVEKLMRKIRF